ncbi:MAG TPA: hypothetical protein VHU40_17800 [Polyangia bacterium]|jgi:hypothetical protein|nr:hypothetical protein [Polyangia bacterium]
MRRTPAFGLLLLLTACPSKPTTPPEPAPVADESKAAAPPCGKVFKDTKVFGGSGCCTGAVGEVLKTADIITACGLPADAFAGQTRDGIACRFHFKTATTDALGGMVMVHHPPVPPGSPAPTAPDGLLPWGWKKVPLRDAIGFQAIPSDEGKPPESQTVLWAGRGRQIIGLRVAKAICTEAQAKDLLQKAIDAAK